jgi:hypothetical protein
LVYCRPTVASGQVAETKRKQRQGLEAVLGQHLASASLHSCLAEQPLEGSELQPPLIGPNREPRLLPTSSSSTFHPPLPLLPLLLLFLLRT